MAGDKKRIRFKPPTEAVAFVVFRIGVKNSPGGHHGGTRVRCKGPPLSDGTVPDMWPISEWSTQRVLEMWGPGRYKVDFYDGGDNLMRDEGHFFDVAHPPTSKTGRGDRRLRPPRLEAVEDDEPTSAAASAGKGFSFLEILTLMRGEREDADRRAEAAKERDREFYAAQQAQQTQLLTVLLGNKGAGVDSDLMRREMQLSIDRGMLGIRQQLFQEEREREPDEPERGDGTEEPPANLEEAGSRIGMAFFSEIERNAPHLLRELVPTVVEWLKPRGFQPSATLQQQIAATLRARNGVGHADSE